MKTNILNVRANEQDIIACARQFVKDNKMGCSAITINKTIYLEKQKTSEKEFFAQFGYEFSNVKKLSYVSNFRYKDMYNKVAKETGNTMDKDKQSGFHTVETLPKCVRIKDTTGEMQLSLNYEVDNKTKFDSIYVVNGKKASDDVIEFINTHKKPHKMSAKQAEAGMTEENEIRFCQWAFDNIVAIGRNQVVEPIWKALKG